MPAATPPHLEPPTGLYVHFPWCVAKCPYCDFNSHPLNGNLDEATYTSALLADLTATFEQHPPKKLQTVFFGGGTPSLFSPDAFARLIEFLQPVLAADAEITMEANPGTAEYFPMAGYHQAGVNRLSLGAQSFNPEHLKKLGRIHNPTETLAAYAAAREGGFTNINLDLMYGLPNQTQHQAQADLQQAIELNPEHISWYQLTIEAKTEFAKRPPIVPVDATVAAIETNGYQQLLAAGFQRYEVSAYAKSSAADKIRACAHNLNYWLFGNYYGVGAGAHSKLPQLLDERGQIQRGAKPRQPRVYLQDPQATQYSAIAESELAAEFLLNALRLTDGVPTETFGARTGLDISTIESQWQQLIAQQLMRPDRLATTARGYALLDGVIQRFL